MSVPKPSLNGRLSRSKLTSIAGHTRFDPDPAFSPGWRADFNEMIDEYLKKNPAVEVVADYRDPES